MYQIPGKYKILGIGVVVLIIGLIILMDSLIVTDEERIELFIEDVTGELEYGYVDKALGYTDLSFVPLDLRVSLYGFTHAGVYDASKRAELRQWVQKHLRRFYNERIGVMGSSIDINGQQADVSLTVISARRLRLEVDLKMQKRGDDWLVTAVNVHR